MERQVYPVGIQSFEQIRTNDFVYVDKTAEIYELVRRPGYYFLGRPRRFGKSLLISTLAAYFEGRRELFEGLAIDRLQPGPWEPRLVVRLDLSGRNFDNPGDFHDYVRFCLENIERKMGLDTDSDEISVKFSRIISGLHERTGRKVALLIDEYDSPMTKNMGKETLQVHYNPFSLLRALKYGKTESYWFETGTPTMLVDYLKDPLRDISDFSGMKVTREALSSVSLIRPQTVALLYQTGYLTIKSYDFDSDRYVIGFPNREVETGFFSSLLPIYADMQRTETDTIVE